ncbi:nucleotide-binding protein [Escherichia coli]|uniref:CD-NTase-associated protein 12/Pycsar effector protein TIR domain-containing protein n=1 Tax=Escherichia coli TaxID=562 RepID=H9AXQ4_ECOLX|nr:MULTISPECIES: nucleotide-binding protein [Escherichia]EBO1758581.1 hypothetical protein [Salmonella enterica subsp. enterica serovar Enteritidis]ECT7021109.1 hypothetical protein [Salmonella enterica subsp. enterica serovar Typhimurium var. 5-]EDL0193046.1 hypothetical protein [Salmonella enterica subsp. enterica serovar Newport]EDM8574510.1 hypothetical protein [Salmonella enterica subsp. enterica serovar Senftenberg]EEE7111510.1 hypothetical protein [Salmonella enterica subsp. enterica se
MSLNFNKIVETIDSYFAIVQAAVTTDSNNTDALQTQYSKAWYSLMDFKGDIWLPTWIISSPTINGAVSSVHLKVEGGTGSWARRRSFLARERENIISLFSRNISVQSDNSQISTISHNGFVIATKNNKMPEDAVNVIGGVVNNRNLPHHLHSDENQVKHMAKFEKMSASPKRKIFIVHGHNDKLKYEVYQLLIEEGYEPVILHLQANDGDTIIEKLEKHFNDIAYAVVLYTSCDVGKAKNDTIYRSRARQNVVFEHGYLISKLGRSNVAAIVEDNVETPGDMAGIIYIKQSDDWRYNLLKELKKLKS